ncbi:hypothetical protein IV203_001285 [Nitzschia inconspicua]|uniref:Uncharacterized protein n=1 Tax=Nitzschia inconspicua TaxID=303405 RepID=A0A9K3L6F9_9STRA|nr:hypothetical protein IV203_001285 [Nitzschia inconspicua]
MEQYKDTIESPQDDSHFTVARKAEASNGSTQQQPQTTSSASGVSLSVSSKEKSSTAASGPSPTPTDPLSSAEVAAGDSAQEEDSTSTSSPDKQRLRKGKWTIEEEEYTSRVIQYFSTGLLALPDGATLRSYLAEKLNCDPMRITKKFTGACCLGRRAYHLRDRPRASPAELEVARLDLQHLEQRFRLRVEHEQSGLPLPPRHEFLAAQPPPIPSNVSSIQSLFSSLHGGTPASNPWPPPSAPPSAGLTSPAAANPASNPFAAAVPGNPFNFSLPNTTLSALSISHLPLASQLLLQATGSERMQANPGPDPSQALNNLIASLLLAQAATKLNQQQQVPQHTLQDNILAPNLSLTQSLSIPVPTPISNSKTSPPMPSLPIQQSNVGSLSLLNFPGIPTGSTQLAAQLHSASQSMPLPPPNPHMSANEERLQEKSVASEGNTNSTKEQQLKAAYEEQQRALRLAFEQSLKKAQEEERLSQQTATVHAQQDEAAKAAAVPDAASNGVAANVGDKQLSPAELLQKSYRAHLASLKSTDQEVAPVATSVQTKPAASSLEVTSGRSGNSGGKSKNKSSSKLHSHHQKVEEDEGKQLMVGFLQSLRGSFEDAVGRNADGVARSNHQEKKKKSRKKERSVSATPAPKAFKKSARVSSEKSTSIPPQESSSRIQEFSKPEESSKELTSLDRFTNRKRKIKPATVTETSSGSSSQPMTEQSSSSLEDSDSKSDKTEQSTSSGDEYGNGESCSVGKVPLRKRLKCFNSKSPNQFTMENVLKHSKQMDLGDSQDTGSASDCEDD